MKVLIVDDSEPVRRIIKLLIRNHVDSVFECVDGSEALTAYMEHRPDLVLMDVEMRQVDGLKATREIKTKFPDARVVIISQWDSLALRQAATEAGAENYVNKMNLLSLLIILQQEPKDVRAELGHLA